MSARKQASKDSKGGNNGFKGFFNPIINQDIKSAVKALELGPEQTYDRLLDLVGAGFKFSVIEDASNTHYTLSLYDRRSGSNSEGYVLSVKHSDLAVGIALLHVLCNEIYEGGGWLDWIKGTNDLDW